MVQTPIQVISMPLTPVHPPTPEPETSQVQRESSVNEECRNEIFLHCDFCPKEHFNDVLKRFKPTGPQSLCIIVILAILHIVIGFHVATLFFILPLIMSLELIENLLKDVKIDIKIGLEMNQM